MLRIPRSCFTILGKFTFLFLVKKTVNSFIFSMNSKFCMISEEKCLKIIIEITIYIYIYCYLYKNNTHVCMYIPLYVRMYVYVKRCQCTNKKMVDKI